MIEIVFKIDLENFYRPNTMQPVFNPFQFNPSPAKIFAFLHHYRISEHLQEDLTQFSEEFNDETRHGELNLKLRKITNARLIN